MTVVRDDEGDAVRHVARKAREYLRKGFAEVRDEPSGDQSSGDEPSGDQPSRGEPSGNAAGAEGVAAVLDVLPGGEDFLPVTGFDEMYRRRLPALAPEAGFHEYLVLRDGGRAAISFNVRARSHDPEAVAVFLGFLDSRRDLPFDGGPHHKLPLGVPVGRFTHALLCSPGLGRSHQAFPGIAARVASACPVFDCEIGDADTEVLVDARVHGHGAVRRAEWDRGPRPVMDLRFDVTPSFHGAARKKFLVATEHDLRGLLGALPGATPESWLEVRSFRGDIRRFTAGTAPAAYEELLPFLLGAG
jgi:hypothetical protein